MESESLKTFTQIEQYEQIFLALRKLAEDGLALSDAARRHALLDGLVPPSEEEKAQRKLDEEQKVRNKKYIDMILKRNAKKLQRA